MSACVEKLPHDCGSSDALQVFLNEDGSYSGHCFKCNTPVKDPYGEGGEPSAKVQKRKKTDEELQEDLEEVGTYPIIDLLESRGLEKATLEHFNVRVALSEEDGFTPVARYLPYYKDDEVVAYKVKTIDVKKSWWVGFTKEAGLFGWKQAIESGSSTLFITTGEEDAMAVYQALREKQHGTKWEHLIPACVSLPHGDGSAQKFLSRYSDKIRSNFKRVVLVFDQDESGQEAVEVAMKVLSNAETVHLPAKDPNDCIIKGRSGALANALLFKSSTPKNSRLVLGSSLHEKGRQQPVMGLSWPWEGLTKLTKGIRWGETIYLGAGVKMGKSEVVNSIGAHFITEHRLRVFMAKPEEAVAKTYQMVCGKISGNIFHDPDREFDFDAYDKASRQVGDNLALLNLYQSLTWNVLREDVISAAASGYRILLIDPITNLINGISSGEANTILQNISQELAALVKDLNLIAFIFCHLKAPLSGDSHERGGKVTSDQFAGSRAMMRSCHMMLSIEGNKDPDLPVHERNIRNIVLLEDREFGNSGKVSLYWSNETGLFTEMKE